MRKLQLLTLTFPLSRLLIISKSVVSDIPPWTMSTLLFTIVPKGNHRYTPSISFSSFSELCYKKKIDFTPYSIIPARRPYLIFRLHLPHKSVSETGNKFKTLQEVVRFVSFPTWNSLYGPRGCLYWGKPPRERPACKPAVTEAPQDPSCPDPQNPRWRCMDFPGMEDRSGDNLKMAGLS